MNRIGLLPEKDLQYGIIVDTPDGFMWVTKIEGKTAIWENGDAYLSKDRESLERICMGLAFHGTVAFTVIIPSYITGIGNYIEKED